MFHIKNLNNISEKNLEMVILGLLLSSRNVVQGINWAKSIKDEEDPMKLFEKGVNLLNSVNYPEFGIGPCESRPRLSICNRNVPNMVSQITRILGESSVNIAKMKNQSKGNYAYTLIDTDGGVDKEPHDDKTLTMNGSLSIVQGGSPWSAPSCRLTFSGKRGHIARRAPLR